MTDWIYGMGVARWGGAAAWLERVVLMGLTAIAEHTLYRNYLVCMVGL